MSTALFSLMAVAMLANRHSVMASPPGNARAVLDCAHMPVASLNDSFSRTWACTTNKTFALHFQSKYPRAFPLHSRRCRNRGRMDRPGGMPLSALAVWQSAGESRWARDGAHQRVSRRHAGKSEPLVTLLSQLFTERACGLRLQDRVEGARLGVQGASSTPTDLFMTTEPYGPRRWPSEGIFEIVNLFLDGVDLIVCPAHALSLPCAQDPVRQIGRTARIHDRRCHFLRQFFRGREHLKV